ncbi:PfkB family carbohydrate kinase [Roseovarius sp. 2305UL8-3]|uniref:PfkB family carbohydrate kinase n=1 Tax=Roseovarius conchicola TaxID=3121636 RepID=UPI003529784C
MSDLLCIGSVLWDVIGRTASHMKPGADVPGRILRQPGGVALNIAMALRRFGLSPALLSAVGRDEAGEELIRACDLMELDTAHIYRSDDLPTDVYMAVEAANGLIAAIADAHSLEAAGARILTALSDGSLGSAKQPFAGAVALDGNLTEALLSEIATGDVLAKADLRLAPASPGKAQRLLPFLTHGQAVLYVNLEEAGLLCQTSFTRTSDAAEALLVRGAKRVLITDGANPACDGAPSGLITGQPPQVLVTRVTGAGDTFMAAHIAADLAGASREAALERALQAAAAHVSGEA